MRYISPEYRDALTADCNIALSSQDSHGTHVSVRVNILKVHSNGNKDRGGRETQHHEVVVFVPALTTALGVREPSGSPADTKEKADMLRALFEFCAELQSVLPM